MTACDVTWTERDPALPHKSHACVFRIPAARHSRHKCICGLNIHEGDLRILEEAAS